MRKFLSIIIFISLLCQSILSQIVESTGKPIAEIFTDFHLNLTDTAKKTGFDLNRAYLGYEFLPLGNFSAKIIINIGTPEDLADGSVPHRYAYCREASLAWSNDKLTISMGITGTRIFEFQQRFWDKRYVANTYQSIKGYGFVADLGLVVDYLINDVLKADLSIMNGEGYSNIQLDDNLRTSVGLTISPSEKIAIRVYGDIQRKEGLWQPVFIGFIGFKNDLFLIGGEVSYKSNIDLIKGHHIWGISTTGGINITENMQIFGRYDYSSSVIMPDDILQWNYLNDGSFAIAGLQYTFSPNVRIALNYQGAFPYTTARQITDLIYLNALFKF
ncbi:MAG: hypothetical protein MUO72_13675 [Bacteroidales bacterium]|nr:hypothetical protein [Bacteroidales bacterium]